MKKIGLNKNLIPTWVYTIIIIIIVQCLAFTLIIPYRITPDSLEYICFSFRDFFDLKLTSGRTPIYPFIIRLSLYLCGERYYLYAVVLVQWIVSLVGCVFLYKIAYKINKDSRVASIITIVYGIQPSIWGWISCILTESFAISGMIFYLYMILSYIEEPKIYWAKRILLLSFFLVFLRPTFLLIFLLSIAFFILRFFFSNDDRRMIKKTIIMSTVLIAFILGYCYIFSLQHGIFSIANSMPRQKLIVCINEGYYKTSSNEKFISMIEAGLANQEPDPWVLSTMTPVLDYFGNREISKLTSECIWLDRNRYIKDIFKLAMEQSYVKFDGGHMVRDNLSTLQINIYRFLEEIMPGGMLKIGHIYCFIIFEILTTINIWMKRREVAWIHIGIFTFMLLITFSTYIATCAEYMRTMIHIVPLIYLSIIMISKQLMEYYSGFLKS